MTKGRTGRSHPFAPKQRICKMSGLAERDKCAGSLTPGLTRNHLPSACVTVMGQGHCHQQTPGAPCPQGLIRVVGGDALSL